NMQTTTVVLFFTRWITHFCAPTFVFLGGVSAFLASQRRSKKEMRQFLLTRGAWLILSDLLIISFIFTFDPTYHVLVLEVLWATGFGMILLAALISLKPSVIAGIGALIFLGHNLLDYVSINSSTFPGGLSAVFLTAVASVIPLSSTRSVVELYAVLPWAAALFMGYGFGQLFDRSVAPEKRRRILMVAGGLLILLFILLRMVNRYGDPSPWSPQRNTAHTLLSFLNASKQPPSLIFLSMTLGPMLILLALGDRLGSRFTNICRVYGNVPYFYFIIHLCFFRLLNLLLIMLQGIPFKVAGYPLVWQVPDFGYSLGVIYLFWVLTIVLLYFPCKWYGDYKRTHSQWWLSYC
ncbi:MAG: DUF1624 domain-containing protein, partial [Mucilaginibacter sp.]